MLVLSRRIGESICIADAIEVKVLEASRGRVRLGIEAPLEVPVHREEVSLRIDPELQFRSRRPSPSAAHTGPEREDLDMKRILIVDDSEVERRLTAGLLANSGYRVEHAENGLAALECLAQSQPSVLLTDLVMPEMDGLELLRVVRRRYPDLPVVLMTAFGNEAMAVEALELGAASYVPKSQRDTKLRTVVAQVHARAQALRSQERLMAGLTDYHCNFQLENDPALIDPMVNLVENSLLGLPLGDKMTRIRVGVALEEALRNALYHGNLEIGEEEFAEAKRAGTLDHLVARRRMQPPYCDRRISVHVMLTREGARFVVRDRGPGFAAASLMTDELQMCFGEGRFRGVTLMRALMDEVVFNGRGNEVALSKHFNPEEQPDAAARPPTGRLAARRFEV